MKFLRDRNNPMDPDRTSKAKLGATVGAVVMAVTEVLNYLGVEADIPEKLIWSGVFAVLFFIRKAM